MANPFPSLVWDKIFENIDDYSDIRNVLEIFPLAIPEWATWGMVLPFLFTWDKWLTSSDIFNCRLVCKRWKSLVDHFLETQSKLLANPVDEDSTILGQIDPTTPNSSHIYTTCYKLDNFNYIGSIDNLRVNLTRYDKLTRIINGTEHLSPDHNPFPGREIGIANSYPRFGGPVLFWRDLLNLLEKFGGHLRRADFTKDNWGYPVLHRKHLCQGLMAMPNLESLRINADLDCNDTVPVSLPLLPHLECLELSIKVLCRDVSKQDKIRRLILTKYSHQLKILTIDLNDWRASYANLFPNLIQLTIEVTGKKLASLLLSINTQNLSKLRLKLSYLLRYQHFSIEKDVFPWLKRFPKITVFSIECDSDSDRIRIQNLKIIEDATLNPVTDSIPSLESLRLFFSFETKGNFLLCLPNLKHLEIGTEHRPYVLDTSNEHPILRLRAQIQNGQLYSSNIWDLFPKLRTIKLQAMRNFRDYNVQAFVKNYDVVSRRKSQAQEFPTMRSDIEEFLGYQMIG